MRGSSNFFLLYLCIALWDFNAGLIISNKFASALISSAQQMQHQETKQFIFKTARRVILTTFIHFISQICLYIFILTFDLGQIWLQLYIGTCCYCIVIMYDIIPYFFCNNLCVQIEQKCISHWCLFFIHICCTCHLKYIGHFIMHNIRFIQPNNNNNNNHEDSHIINIRIADLRADLRSDLQGEPVTDTNSEINGAL